MDIWECALGFMDAQALMTAEALGVFAALETQPRTAAEAAGALGLPEDSMQRLLNLLSARGITVKADGRYRNTRQASEQLVPGRPGYIGGLFVHLREELYPIWGHLGEALRAGRTLKDTLLEKEARFGHDSPRLVRAFMDGMHAITYAAAAEFARQARELAGVRSVVDVGGASGALLIALAERHAGLTGTVIDLAYVKDIAEAKFRAAGVQGRLRFVTADFFADPLPAGADAYVLGFILHDWRDERGEYLLRRIAEPARPGTLLIVSEYLLNDDKAGPLHVVRADLNMMVAAEGRERTAAEYKALLKSCGFALERIYTVRDSRRFMVARRDG